MEVKLAVSDTRPFEGYEGRVVQVGNSSSGEQYRLVRILSPYEIEVEKVDG